MSIHWCHRGLNQGRIFARFFAVLWVIYNKIRLTYNIVFWPFSAVQTSWSNVHAFLVSNISLVHYCTIKASDSFSISWTMMFNLFCRSYMKYLPDLNSATPWEDRNTEYFIPLTCRVWASQPTKLVYEQALIEPVDMIPLTEKHFFLNFSLITGWPIALPVTLVLSLER